MLFFFRIKRITLHTTYESRINTIGCIMHSFYSFVLLILIKIKHAVRIILHEIIHLYLWLFHIKIVIYDYLFILINSVKVYECITPGKSINCIYIYVFTVCDCLQLSQSPHPSLINQSFIHSLIDAWTLKLMAEFVGSQPGRGRKSRNRTTTKILFWNVEFHLILLQAVILIGDRGQIFPTLKIFFYQFPFKKIILVHFKIWLHAGERVVPNKVLEVMKEDVRSSEILKAMNVQKLTRAHVGSHLQVGNWW